MTRLETLEARYFGDGSELSEKEMDEFRTLVAERDNIKRAAAACNFRVTSGPTPWRNPIVFSGR